MVQDLENEIWVTVEGYEGLYEVSNMGRIKTLERWYSGGIVPVKITERLRKLQLNHKGYYSLLLNKDSKSVTAFAHRVVAKSFIPNPENKPQINHKNGVKTDNRVENLEWATGKENVRHCFDVLGHKSVQPKGALSPFSKRIKCPTLGLEFSSIIEAAEILGISNTTIGRVCAGKYLQTKGLVFNYIC